MEDEKKRIRVRLPETYMRLGVNRTGSSFTALWTTALITAGLAFTAPAMAQGGGPQNAVPATQSGLVVTPYVSLETLYDSNIFESPSDRVSDTVLRLSPGLGVGYRSPRSTFNFSYTFDSERYSTHSSLNTWDARQVGAIGGTYAFTSRFTGGLLANYFETYYPGELIPVSTVVLARKRATHIDVRPTARYQFDSRTFANFFYDRSRENVSGGITTFISKASAAVARDLTRRDRLTFQYQTDWYSFSTGTSPMSHVFRIGWRHKFSPETSLSLVAGPRDTDGRTIADVFASLRHETQNTSQTLAYTRGQLTLAGQTGVYDTRFWVAIFGFHPTPRWSIQLKPSYYKVSQGDQDAKGYHVGLEARYWFARDWSVAMSYDYNRQNGVLGTVNDVLILRNVLALSLTWALPTGSGYATLPTRRAYGAQDIESGK